MKIAGKKLSLRLIVVLIWGVFALILTTQSDRVPLVHLMTTTIGSTEAGDAFGHAGLFAMLCLLLYVALSWRLPPYRALLIAMTIALVAGNYEGPTPAVAAVWLPPHGRKRQNQPPHHNSTPPRHRIYG